MRSSRSRPDGGFTLVEVLVVIVLIGGALAAILTLVATTSNSSGRNREQVGVYAVLESAGERITSRDQSRLACAPTSSANPVATAASVDAIKAAYQATARLAALPNDPGWNPNLITVTDVKFWGGDAKGFTNECYEQNGLRNQLVTIRVDGPAGRFSESIEVVKSNA